MLVIMLRKAGVNSQVEVKLDNARQLSRLEITSIVDAHEGVYQRKGYTVVRSIVYI